jgi:hypothetical protein
MLTLAVKRQWVRCKLDETIEQSCSDFLAHTLEVCKSARRYNEYSATSAECKTVITAVLTVMSGMDPHMISGNTRFGLAWLGCRSGFY